MIKWDGGPLPFKADAISTLWDEAKCLLFVYRDGDKLYFRKRGSMPPYPFSEACLIGQGYSGSGSFLIWADGFINIFWPDDQNRVVQQRYKKATAFPDPSAGAIVKLDSRFRVPELYNRYGYPIKVNTLIPSYGIERALDEAKWCSDFWNRGFQHGMFNGIRFFSFGVWEDFTFPRVIFPYAYDGSRFDCFVRNPLWIETLDRRIGQIVEREGSVTLTILDGCSTHNYPNSHWGLHPWNGRNNVNDSSPWADSPWHFYEDEHQGKHGIQVTAQIIEDHVRFLPRHLEKYAPNITYEIANEAHAAEGWHSLIRGWLREEGVTEDWRVMTSMDGVYNEQWEEWPYLTFYLKQMHQYLTYCAHGIQTVEEYEWMKKNFMPRGVNFQASEDGLEPIAASQYREFVKKILKLGAHGIELNQRPWWKGNVFNPDLLDWEAIKETGKGFKDFLG